MVEINYSNKAINLKDISISILETRETVYIDSLRKFYVSLPSECTEINMKVAFLEREEYFVLTDIEKALYLILRIDDEQITLMNHKSRSTPDCLLGEKLDNLPTYNYIQRRPIPTFTYFNKAMGM